jgi:2-polyprenyl-3-methyl-5-hydroxy-6-metoxy-1,4-benzoquinol methylase
METRTVNMLEATGMKAGIKTVEVACNFCGSVDRQLVTTGKEHEYDNTTSDVFNVVRCKGCSLVYLNPRPDVCELNTIYPPNYYAYNQQKLREEADNSSILHRLRYRGFMAKIAKGLSLCPKREPVKVLDIGCGDGHFLNLFRESQGDKVETHGVDFNGEAIKEAERKGHTTYTGRFEDVTMPVDYFDLVTASHVIEHVEDPRAFTEKAYKILRPGGIFWFETPNIGSLDARLFQSKHWGAYHFPRHWFYFDPQSIKHLAKLTGFEVAMIDYYPNAIFWYWTFHSMIISANPKLRSFADLLFPAIDFQKNTLANFLRICFFSGIDVIIKKTTGQTSNMAVAFRKPQG